MRRTILPAAAILLTAACAHLAPSASSPSTAPSPSDTSIFLPQNVNDDLDTIRQDTGRIAGDTDDNTILATDCRTLGTDASKASTDTLPAATWQSQWTKTMNELQRSADECSSGATTGDTATMQQALTDLTSANDDLQTFNDMTR